MTKYEQRGWIPASVGCHWTRGDYTISTFTRGKRSGYALYYKRACVAECKTFEGLECLADRRQDR